MKSPPLAALGVCVLEVSEVYVREGKRYFRDPVTHIEKEDDARRWQARIDEIGNLIPLTDAERQRLEIQWKETMSELPVCSDSTRDQGCHAISAP